MKRKIIALEGLGIELRPLKPLGFHPRNVVVGISSEGIVAPLVASHLIQQLDMDQVCALESPMFPPTSMVYFQKPKFPARIYASKDHGLAVILAEFAPMDELARPLAQAIMAWCGMEKAGRLIGIEGYPAGTSNPAGVGVAAIGSTARDRRSILKARLSEVRHGAINGVAGVLLNEGRWLDRETIALMASMRDTMPDTEAAVRVLAAIGKLIPRLPIEEPSGGREPTRLEHAIRTARDRSATHEFI